MLFIGIQALRNKWIIDILNGILPDKYIEVSYLNGLIRRGKSKYGKTFF